MKHLVKSKSCFIVMVLLFVSACGSSKSPVSSRSTIDRFSESEKLGGRIITIVQPGDTWYGIAFGNSIDVSELTAWNGQTESDTLMTGQRLRLTKPLGFKNTKSSASSSSVKENKNARTVQVRPSRPSEQKSTSTPSKPNRDISSKTANASQTKVPARVASKPENQVKQFKQTQFSNKPVQWAWPLRGKVVSRFSPNLGRKGIDISAKQNQAVKVAAPGKVVYQGNGVKGYRNLIIIKHNENLLSAYAHNQQVYVQEGQWVSANQTISTVGLKMANPCCTLKYGVKVSLLIPLSYLGS